MLLNNPTNSDLQFYSSRPVINTALVTSYVFVRQLFVAIFLPLAQRDGVHILKPAYESLFGWVLFPTSETQVPFTLLKISQMGISKPRGNRTRPTEITAHSDNYRKSISTEERKASQDGNGRGTATFIIDHVLWVLPCHHKTSHLSMPPVPRCWCLPDFLRFSLRACLFI